MKCLVSGSNGFIGTHLVKRLKNEGYEVIGWDIETGQDVCDSNLAEWSLDAIFHLACPVDPDNYEKVALPTALASSLGTYNMLELALKNRAKFLYVSSSDIYGSSHESFTEDNWGSIDPVGERSYYGESKRFGEMLTMIYYRNFGLDVRIVRPFNIYGSGMKYDDSRVISSFFRAIKENKPLKVNDSGNSTRTFCYIDDFIEVLIRTMFYEKTKGEIFNIGTTEDISMYDLAEIMVEKFGGIVEVVKKTRVGEPRNRKPDITKAIKLLNWLPTTNLEEGLEEMWKNFQ